MSGVTIREMENVARSMGGGGGMPPEINLTEELGNVINLNDMGDDLGLSMLANPSLTNKPSSSSSSSSSSSAPPPRQQASVSWGGSGSGSGGQGLQEVEIASLEPMSFDASFPAGPVNLEIRKDTGGDVGSNLFANQQTATGPTFSLPASRNPEEEKKEKIEFINKLQRLESKGFPVTRHYTLDNSLDEIKQEYLRLVDARQMEASLRFQRQMLMGVITGMEWMNNKFDPFDLKLEGWSESVHENVEDFDEIFEELYDKYKDRGKVAPEVRLMMALAGSGFMCHVSNSFFRQKMPSMDDVMRKNPELARQMAAAAAQQVGPGFGNFMGAAMPGAQQPQQMPAPFSQPPAYQSQGPPMQPQGPTMGAGAFMNSSRVPNMPQSVASVEPPRATARREMRGPTGVDDILKTFEEVRRAEVQEAQGIQPGFSAPGPAPSTLGQDLQSVHSEEMASQAESQRTAGGRRKKRQAPQGNTLSLNV